MANDTNDIPPLGGWFGTLGVLVGMFYGNAIAGGVGVIVGLVVGGLLGLFIENLIFRLILVALFILLFIARQALFGALFESATAQTMTEYQQAQVERCSPLAISQSGVTWDAHTSAGRFSDQAPGYVGISIFPGGDLINFTAHELGLRLVEVLNERDAEIVVRCFVDEVPRFSGGTAIGFVVNGITITDGGKEFFNMDHLNENRNLLDVVIAESATGRLLLAPATI